MFHATLGEHQGIGPNQSQIADEFQNHAATQTAQQLAALVTPDPHHEVFIDLIDTDHVTLPSNVETTPWHLADRERLPFALSTVVPQPGLAGNWSAQQASRAPFYFDRQSDPLITATTRRAGGPADLIRCEVPRHWVRRSPKRFLKQSGQLHDLQYCRAGHDFLTMGITLNAICQ